MNNNIDYKKDYKPKTPIAEGRRTFNNENMNFNIEDNSNDPLENKFLNINRQNKKEDFVKYFLDKNHLPFAYDYQMRLKLDINKKIELLRLKVKNAVSSKGFTNIIPNIQNNYLKLDGYIKQIETNIKLKQKESEKSFSNLVYKLDALSPLKTLCRGYVIAQKDCKIVKSSLELKKGDKLELKFKDGTKNVTVQD